MCMPDPSYVSLAAFAATFAERDDARPPAWVHPAGQPLQAFRGTPLAERLEEVLDTVVALQRAEWLQDGVYLGPRTFGEAYRDLLETARALGIAVPPAVVASCGMGAQGTFGTDDRPFLLLSSFFFGGAADEGERRFLLGRLCGTIRAGQVTGSTLYAALVDHDGIRKVARRTLGPTLEVVLAPLSLGARLALSRWHRAAELTADRAGLVACRDLDAARRALLRIALGLHPRITPEDYLEQLRGAGTRDAPGRWAEALASQPWLHKRMEALDLFGRSTVYAQSGVEAGGAAEGPLLDPEELTRRTDLLLRVG